MGYRGWRRGMGGMQMRAYVRRRAISFLTMGTIFLVIGIAITAGTYSIAASSPDGGTYLVSFGPIIIGVLWLIRGLMLLARSSRLP